MNFDEAARTFQMTPPPANNFMPASFDLHYNMNLNAKHSPKLSLHSRSNTISDDSFGLKLHAQNIKKDHHHEIKTPETNMSHSDTYDDDMDTETDDYLSHDDEDDDDDDHDDMMDEDHIYDEHKAEANDTDAKKDKSKRSKKRKAKSRLRSRTLSRPYSANTNFLRIPNESDDNFDDFISDDRLDTNLSLPPIMNNKLHIRSYSESNIQKSIQNNQWPSSASSEDSFDFNARGNADSAVYSRYVSMKKKYKKQRRISRQFQDAITVIQDENEDVMQMNEEQIRAHFEKEYEMKLIELEHEKLNTAINIEDKMKLVMIRNDELMLQNKQLQQQVVAQVAMIQEQQHISLQQQRQFVAIQSGNISPTSSAQHQSPLPINTVNQFPSTHPLLGRQGSSTPCAVSKYLGLTPMSSNGESYTLNDDVASVGTDMMYEYHKYNVNMEPSNKYKSKKHQISKRKRLKDVEKKVCQVDEEMAHKMRPGQSPWNRFLDLMTPSFCSCSPNVSPTQNQPKSLSE